MKKNTVLLGCLLTLFCTSVNASANNAMNQVRAASDGINLEIEGSAQLSVPNDSAVVYLRIAQRHRLPEQARHNVTVLSQKTLEQLKSTLPGAQIQTLSVNSSPIYADDNGKRHRIETWQASQTLQVKTDQLETLPQLLNQLPEEVIVDTVNFELKEQSRRQWDQKLTQMAISDATEKAAYATKAMGYKASNVRLNSLIFGDKVRYANRMDGVHALGASKASETLPMEAGQTRLSMRVQAQMRVLVPKAKH